MTKGAKRTDKAKALGKASPMGTTLPYGSGISGSIIFSASGTILNIYYNDPEV